MGDGDVERAVRIGEAFEFDPERLAHDAAGALGADEIAPANAPRRAVALGEPRLDPVRALLERNERGAHAQVAQLVPRDRGQRLLADLDPLALQDMGEGRGVGDQGVIEFRDHLTARPVPILERPRLQAARFEPIVEAERGIHLQCHGMVRSRPRHLVGEVRPGDRLQQCHGDAALDQLERQHEPDRPRADDDDAVVCGPGAGSRDDCGHRQGSSEVGSDAATMQPALSLKQNKFVQMASDFLQ